VSRHSGEGKEARLLDPRMSKAEHCMPSPDEAVCTSDGLYDGGVAHNQLRPANALLA
jgi:hypothetical protein